MNTKQDRFYQPEHLRSGDGFFARERLAGYSSRMLDTPLLILGAGAGGNELALTLTQWGFRRATIVDFDAYELSNATRTLDFPYERVAGGRPVYKARETARSWRRRLRRRGVEPEIDAVVDFAQALPPRVWERAGVVLGCVDHPRARYDIAALARLHGLPLITGGFDARSRTVQVAHVPGHSAACYACNLSTVPDYGASGTSCTHHALREIENKRLPSTPNLAKSVGALMAQVLVDGLTDGFGDAAWLHRLHLGTRSRPATVRVALHPNDECACRLPIRMHEFRPRSHRLQDVVSAAQRLGALHVALPATLPVALRSERTGAMLRVGVPAWRCRGPVDEDSYARAAEFDDEVSLNTVTIDEVHAYGLGDLDVRAFGWGVGARLRIRREDGPALLRWTSRTSRTTT